MSFFFPSKPFVSLPKTSLKGIFWIPLLLFCSVILLGFRFYEKPLGGGERILFPLPSVGFLQAAATNPNPPTSSFPPTGSAPTQKGSSAVRSTPSETSSAQKTEAGRFQPSMPASSQSPQQPVEKTPVNASATYSNSPDSSKKTEAAPVSSPSEPAVNKKETSQASPQDTENSLDILNLTTEEVKILQTLSTRRSDIEKREKSVLERENLLKVVEKRIDQKIQDLQKIRDVLKEMVASKEKQEKERMQGLVKIYELMKPDKAAAILSGLEVDVLLEVLDFMNERKLSPILSAMDPRVAQRITVELAIRRKFTQEVSQVSKIETAPGPQSPESPQPEKPKPGNP